MGLSEKLGSPFLKFCNNENTELFKVVNVPIQDTL